MMARWLDWPGEHPVAVLLLVLIALAAAASWLLRKSPRLRQWIDRHQNRLLVGAVVSLFVLTYFAPNMFITIPPGAVGIVWRRFAGGTDLDTEYRPGTHVIAPWNVMYIYNGRVQRTDLDVTALTQEGLAVEVDVTIHHRLVPGNIGELHEAVGPDYVRVVLVSEMLAAVRAVASKKPYTEVYRITEAEISAAVRSQAKFQLQAKVINLADIQVTGVVLPPQVQQAVQEKLQRQQQIGEMYYRLDVERLEKERKTIEAEGIQTFQSIVSAGISEPFLKWKGIDATLALARSNNAKVVVIGAGEDGLPIILGGLEGAAPGGPVVGPVAEQRPDVSDTIAPPVDTSIAPMPAAEATPESSVLQRLLSEETAPPPSGTPAPPP